MKADIFKEELEVFEKKKKELLQASPGQFALIKGQEIVGVFPSREEAYREGVTRFRQEAFLIKRIVEEEQPEQVPLLAYAIHHADL